MNDNQDPTKPAPKYEPRPVNQRHGNALCLSGGGYRAALFHLGGLRRLNELNVLSKLNTIVSVSGGSIMAAHLATRVREWPTDGPIQNWENEIAAPLRAFVRRNIRTVPVLKRALPWNWFRSETAANGLAQEYEKHLTAISLVDLPVKPNFVFAATDLTFGVAWIFERDRAGDYKVGYVKDEDLANWKLARAVAASSCFPPVFAPMSFDLDPAKVKEGTMRHGPERDSTLRSLLLTDGGVYDNMGLEPVWKDHKLMLVSDGGSPFVQTSPEGSVEKIMRYVDVIGHQAQALRKRWLISNFRSGLLEGSYWGLGSITKHYNRSFKHGYSEPLVSEVISNIRTDMDAFSDAEMAVLENHGYYLAGAAISTHVPSLESPNIQLSPPHPDWMDEIRVRKALRNSHKRVILGRPFG